MNSASEQTSDSKREPGFYHIRTSGKWIAAQWQGNYWMLPGRDVTFADIHFDEIDERRIERPSPQQQPDNPSQHGYKYASNKPTVEEDIAKVKSMLGQPDELSKAQERIRELEYLLDDFLRNYELGKQVDDQILAVLDPKRPQP